MAFVIVNRQNTIPMETHKVDVPQGSTVQQVIADWAGTRYDVGTEFYVVDPATVQKYTLQASLQSS